MSTRLLANGTVRLLSLAAAVFLGTGPVSSALTPTLKIPTLSPNEAVVAMATPQQYGAKGDGTTDDTAAFQAAIDAVYATGQRAGGVLYVPAAQYAFYGNLTLPEGVTLRGDWKDWVAAGTGAAGTIFKIYTTGAADGTPFLYMRDCSTIKGVTFWYPNQSAANIQPYPYTIRQGNDSAVQNVIFVNSYQGLSGGDHRDIQSSIIGTTLWTGIYIHGGSDPAYAEDLRFNPDVWSASKLLGAPAATGPHKTWMRANGVGMRIGGCGGKFINAVNISGYLTGIWLENSGGTPSISFYEGSIADCGTGLMADYMQVNGGAQFTWFDISGDIAMDRAALSNGIFLQMQSCTLTGTGGTAIRFNGGGTGNARSWIQLQSCNINGLISQSEGVINAVNCTLPASSPQCILNSGAVRAAFTACAPSPTVTNNAGAGRVVIESRAPIPNDVSLVSWASIKSDYESRRPAKQTLFIATAAPYNATGDGVTDDTDAIQAALNAASANSGGIVYLPGGHYKTTGTLTIPTGVELRGVYELNHQAGPWPDGFCKDSVIQPYGGNGT